MKAIICHHLYFVVEMQYLARGNLNIHFVQSTERDQIQKQKFT